MTTTAPAEETTSTVEAKGELTFAMSGLYKPFNYKKDGELVGFDVEIGKALAETMGVTPNPVTNPWETILEGLKSKKYDAIIGSMAITEKRLEQVDFTRPYYRSGAQVFVAAGNNTIASPEDLAGKKIGVVKASTFKDIAVTLTDEDKVVGYDSDVIALQDLTSGRIDAVITDAVVGFAAIMENGLEIKDVAEPLYVDEMGIAVRKEDTALLDELNAALEAIIADGTYDQISQKWLGRNILGE
ncbi:MAG: ABC transporter substrate-binding protein [Thermoleophilia bacterium]|nr:ABC transporter substrate-binding protein [Thermoleophilia bacterium]